MIQEIFDIVDPAHASRRLADLNHIGFTSDDGITRPA
jgi:hypothetical protein